MSLRDHPPGSYGTVTRLFHWVTAGIVVIQIPVGIAMTSEAAPDIGDFLFILHKGMGSVFLPFVVARLIWKFMHPVSPLLPTTPPLQRRIAALTHGLLYVLLVALPITGYVRTVGDGYPIELLDAIGIPPLVTGIPETAHLMLVIHKFSAYLLTAVIAAHLGAAVHHGMIERDGVMSRIWPPVRARGSRISD